jgi:hypothetical protein
MERRVHGAGKNGLVGDERHRDPHGPEPVQVVRRPVEGVDDPPEAAPGASELLALDRDVRCF